MAKTGFSSVRIYTRNNAQHITGVEYLPIKKHVLTRAVWKLYELHYRGKKF